jgi:arylsulfatase A-like enzyme
VTLDEAMKSAGLFTSGISGNGYVTEKWGFGNTWDRYKNHIHEGGGLRAEEILKAALKSVEDRKDTPFFLYLGTLDTHVSWYTHEPWLSRYDGPNGPYSGPWQKLVRGKDLEEVASGKLKITDRDKQRAIAFYDAAVSYQDEQVGKLLEGLKAWGILDDTMIIITADHGEELWEEGRFASHGIAQTDTLVHVPLIVYYPPLFPAGLVEEGADTLDIIPTVLDALEAPIPQSLQGESLLPLAQGAARGYARPTISSMYERSHAMSLAGFKIIAAQDGSVKVFDLENDPGERKELSGSRPLERRMLTDALSTFLVYQKQWRKWSWGVASNVTSKFAEDLEK